MSIFAFDFDKYNWTWYNWVAVRVTGNSQHAFNGLVAYLFTALFFSLCIAGGTALVNLVIPIGVVWWRLPLLYFWPLVGFFYTKREWPFTTSDNRGDVVWVYLIQTAILPIGWWYIPLNTLAAAAVLYFQADHWSKPAPRYIPRGTGFKLGSLFIPTGALWGTSEDKP